VYLPGRWWIAFSRHKAEKLQNWRAFPAEIALEAAAVLEFG
jgi:hypothetical protein